jgi:DNA-binding NtrC family response regulator
MRRVASSLTRMGPRQVPVLVEGETGTGKELAARALHELSPRRRGPFVAVNCGALSPELALSELLGHERGAFTGAARRHRGAFEQAYGGTLFLDEVGELDPRVQAALLRVLETDKVRRVGGSTEIGVDARVVAATNRNVDKAVARGRFRLDLLHRLAVLRLEMPPLRTRVADLPDLVDALLLRAGSHHVLSDEALKVLAAHSWPGNVRELKNVLERAIALAPGQRIGPRQIRIDGNAPAREGDDVAALLAVVEHHGGSVAGAARALGMPRTTLRDKLERARLAM